ncbi:MAG: phospholipase D-like domain-containing protein, partial [Allosphingosinicella sp.]
MTDGAERNPAEPVSVEVAGNRLTLLADGPERLDALVALIDGAERDLRILYYIFLDDAAGTRVRDAMIAAAARGVEVSLLVDGFGATASRPFWQPLIDSGVHFCRFSPRYGRRYLLRNHQKLALADGRKVIIGGFNVSDDYFGTIEAGAWRDLGLRVEGDSTACLVKYFDDLFGWATKPDASIRDLRRMLQQHSVTEGKLHWLFGGPTRRLSPWARAMRRDMRGAMRIDI